LVEIGSAAMPMTEMELQAVNGVGQRKLERFGEAFMELIIDYCRR
jgi:superfamily II DNA helicase RecQ